MRFGAGSVKPSAATDREVNVGPGKLMKDWPSRGATPIMNAKYPYIPCLIFTCGCRTPLELKKLAGGSIISLRTREKNSAI